MSHIARSNEFALAFMILSSSYKSSDDEVLNLVRAAPTRSKFTKLDISFK